MDGPKKADKERTKVFSKEMRKTSAFWNMGSIHFLGCVGHAVILVYLVPIARAEGLSLVTAASLLTVMSAVSVVSRIFTPILSDTIGTKPVMAFFYFIQGVTVIMLFWTHDLWMFYTFAIVFGIGYGGEAGGFPILNRRYYGHAPTGSPYGFQMLGAGLGMALGGWVGGPIYDMTGSYDLALWVSIATSLLGMVSILMLEPTKKLLIPDWEQSDTMPSAEAGGARQAAPSPAAGGDD
jgi:MFS family permease